MHNLFKFEGRINRIELSDAMLDALRSGTDSFITSSAILSGMTGSISLGAQTVFLASKSKLLVDTMVMEVDGKVFVGKFHRIYLQEGDYVVCVAKNIRDNIYELYSVLSPESGLLYMQVGMGASVKPAKKSTKKAFYFLYIISTVFSIILFLYLKGLNFENIIIIILALVVSYFILFYLIHWASKPVFELSEISELVFDKFGFKNTDEIYMLTARYRDPNERRFLESVYEYRRVIQDDPYPENYVESKTKK
ncbi:putative type VI secretion system effector [Acinetobacter sp. YH12239]|uniref:putative type VI secretion system effector n=1 Tax=Acinetobacter sp. YH12239 TaxID=2601166 RepID=UPI0015D29E97|nr:putative type VI secretion system effector [Acinetobacter sp. YH12239]